MKDRQGNELHIGDRVVIVDGSTDAGEIVTIRKIGTYPTGGRIACKADNSVSGNILNEDFTLAGWFDTPNIVRLEARNGK